MNKLSFGILPSVPLRGRYGNLAGLASLTLVSLLIAAQAKAQNPGGVQEPGADPNRITDQYIPLRTSDFPNRPHPVLELGNPFLGTGPIGAPWHSPTGQILVPTVLVWGNLRSGYSLQKRGTRGSSNRDRSVWANRLDLFLEGRLSPTERIVLGMRPLDEDGVFTGYDFERDDNIDGTNGSLSTAFIEGDFGEIFPGLDEEDTKALDIGFGVGRQPVNFQDGIMINDVMDSATVTRNSLRFWGMSNFLATGLVAWNGIHRGNSVEDEGATLLGLMTAGDFACSYVQVDTVLTLSSDDRRGDGFYFGIGGTQRIGKMNSTFRINTSLAFDDSRAPVTAGVPAVSSGVLATAQLSWVPHYSEDNVYLSAFAALDEYTGAARDPAAGGPLGIMGITFAATGLGGAGAPLVSRANEVVGGALGYQHIFDHGSQQLIYEVGGRATTESSRKDSSVAAGTRYQTAFGQHAVFLIDVFVGYDELDYDFYGGRCELLWKF